MRAVNHQRPSQTIADWASDNSSMAKFIIGGKEYNVDLGDSVFRPGENEVLSTPATDITHAQPWYPQGYGVFNLLNDAEFKALQNGIARCVRDVVRKLGVPADFELEKYHQHVCTTAFHHNVVSITRDLFPEDFDFNISDIIEKLGKLVGFGLSDIDPNTGKKQHIIIRINRPHSTDYNPPHKDIYGDFDDRATIPKIINFWLPICGVSSQSMLPVVPGSHLLPESALLRTFDGGMVGGNRYRVRSILQWDGKNEMYRPPIQYGQVLIFTTHLIHGIAINDQDDATRVALEFRLFKMT